MKIISKSRVESRESRKHGRRDGLVRLPKAAPKGANNRAGASESIVNRADLYGVEIDFSQPSTFDLRPSTSTSGLNSGVPTPLAPLGLLQKSQYEARGSARIACEKHSPQGCHSRERGQQSNLLCLGFSRNSRPTDCFAGYNAAPAARCSPVGGFSLVEIVIAMGIAAFCLVAIFGLIPAGLKTNKESLAETTAAGLASRIAADLRATPTTTNVSALYQIPFPSYAQSVNIAASNPPTSLFLKDDGSINPVTTMGVNYRATIVIYNPNKSPSRVANRARILITWPALADTNALVPPSHFTGFYEVVIGIDRN